MTAIEDYWAPNERTGFIPQRVPSTPAELAASSSKTMQLLGSVTPRLGTMSDDEIEEFVASLPVESEIRPEGMRPEGCEAAIRAYVSLTAHLIHRSRFATRRELPASVARPLWLLSEYVGRPPSLTYAAYVLGNLTSPIHFRARAEDIEIAQTPTGSKDEEWFVAVHLSVESSGGEVVKAIGDIERALECGDEKLLVVALESIGSCMAFAERTMPTVRERLDADIFRDVIRPLLYGHDRIVFRGVPGEPTVMYIGETGAQSGVIRAVDAVLGTRHTDNMVASMNRFLDCAPPAHRHYIKKASELGHQLALAAGASVREARRAALRAVAQFRRTHLLVVMEYLVPQGKQLTTHGTGGTEFKAWLEKLIDETEAAVNAE